MRALRDFNIPKVVTDDMPVFMGLIGDLFPALEVPRKRDAEFERTVKQAAIDLNLQPEDNFILKVIRLINVTINLSNLIQGCPARRTIRSKAFGLYSRQRWNW